jgi:4-hydroxybenzoate polyprenyltransferase
VTADSRERHSGELRDGESGRRRSVWRGLVLACHPLPSAAVTAVATAFAAAAGRGTAGSGLVAVTVLASQLSIGWENDYLDRDRDLRSGRRDKPIPTGMVSAGSVAIAAVAATVVMIGSLPLHGWRAAGVGLVAWLSAEQYNRWVKKTRASFLPYTISFGLLPSFVLLGGSPGEWAPGWLTAAAALLGAGAHFANVLPDIGDDLATGVRGLPQGLGQMRSAALSVTLLAAASALLVLGPGDTVGPSAVVAAVAVLVGTAGMVVGLKRARAGQRSTAPFVAAIGIALVDVVLFLLSGSRVT